LSRRLRTPPADATYAMKTLFFFTFVIAMLGLGVAWLRARARHIAEESEARAQARAELLGLVAAAGAIDTDEQRVPSVPRAATATPTAAPTAVPAVASVNAPIAAEQPANFFGANPTETVPAHGNTAAPESGPPSSRRLRKMSRGRFARVTITYFEILGFRARRFANQDSSNAHIDALLFMGSAGVPTMAVRWSRSEGERATIDEIRAFADACTALRIPRSSFVAQFGIDDEAAGYADSCGVVCLDAETLARRLADTDVIHHARLHEVAYGER
jgi:hypothetical protein